MEQASLMVIALQRRLLASDVSIREINAVLIDQVALNMANGSDRDKAAHVFRCIADGIERGEYRRLTVIDGGGGGSKP